MDVIALRRELHQRPELGFTEIITAARVIGELEAAGWEISYGSAAIDVDGLPGLPSAALLEDAVLRARDQGVDPALVSALSGGRTAVVADLTGSRPGPVVALRFDMDALPIEESAEGGHLPADGKFRSLHPGVMHACGHDGHVAIGIALARRLADRDFPGRVRLLFQPAEEGVRGARGMIRAGVLEGVDQMYVIHLGCGLPVGTVAPSSDGRLATTKLRARFTGRASHAATAPEQGRNALLAAASATLNLHALPRFAAADTRVNVGRLVAGAASNIIAPDAEMLLEVRSTDGAVNAEMERRARNVLQSSAASYEVDVLIEETGRATTARGDQAAIDAFMAAAGAVSAVAAAQPETVPVGSDDATLFMNAVQEAGGIATYGLVGADNPAPHHSPRFDIDERSLPLAVDLLDRLIRDPAGSALSRVTASAPPNRRQSCPNGIPCCSKARTPW
jgi:aminobenzoyl-glutamate utilization protein A